MKTFITPNEDGKGYIISSIGNDVEYVNPIDYYKNSQIGMNAAIYEKLLITDFPKMPLEIIKRTAYLRAAKDWEELYKSIVATEIPPNLINLLNTTNSKKEQIKLLRGLQITPDIFAAFIFKAFSDYGYTYSSYRSEHLPKSIDQKDMPMIAKIDPDTKEITKIGKTNLSDKQIKSAIEERKVVVTRFLDNGNNWHAFFITYRSIGGNESWKDGQPHYHYISDKFLLPRHVAVSQFKSEKYPSTSIHIELLDYGKQP